MNNQIKSLQAENNALKAKDATQDVLQCNTQGGALYVKYFCET